MNYISVRCDIVFEMCCLDYAINRESMECDLWLNSRTSDEVVKLRELCLSKWYLIYILCIFNCLVSLLARNVITHSLCVVVFGSCDDLK